MKTVLRIVEDYANDGEHFYLNGKHIVTTSHDEHGWSGMGIVRDTLTKIAETMEWKVEYGNIEED